MINTMRSALTDKVWHILFKLMLNKEDMPDDLSCALEHAKEFIGKNPQLFLPDTADVHEISFIIRKTFWQRSSDKFVIMLFSGRNIRPFAVVKAGSAAHKISIESEFRNTMSAYNMLGKDSLFAVPEPLSCIEVNDSVMYFERSVGGLPVNNYLKLIAGKQKKLCAYLDILEKCRSFLLNLNSQKEQLNQLDYIEYFYRPIEDFKTATSERYSLRLDTLKDYADNIMTKTLNAVLMHGDMWGGSILLDGNKIYVIDWEFFTERGVPLWDFFSFAFHSGESLDKDLPDFMNYFTDREFSKKVDDSLHALAEKAELGSHSILFLFQTFLLYNIRTRDTEKEHYWQDCLEYYWDIPDDERNRSHRLL